MKNFRSSHQRCSVKKGLLRNFAKFTKGHFPWTELVLWNGEKKTERSRATFGKLWKKKFEENIGKYVDWKDDEKLKAQPANSEFTAKEIKYHAICCTKYQKESEANCKIMATK